MIDSTEDFIPISGSPKSIPPAVSSRLPASKTPDVEAEPFDLSEPTITIEVFTEFAFKAPSERVTVKDETLLASIFELTAPRI